MPDEAVQAAWERLKKHPTRWQYVSEQDIREILEAAAPALAANERRKTAEEFRVLASHFRAVPDRGLNLGQIWQRDEQARDYDRIADMIMKGAR
jgi:hypothetical protein